MSNNIQDTDVQQGRKCSLWQLAAENAIVIPIIQRDYAQGRSNDKVRQIRQPFLKKIFKDWTTMTADSNSTSFMEHWKLLRTFRSRMPTTTTLCLWTDSSASPQCSCYIGFWHCGTRTTSI